MSASDSATFGSLLKAWRARRRVSQMDLAFAAELSQRHVSFIEVGRAGASRVTVERLAEALAVPCAERDRFYLAAGYAPPVTWTAWSEAMRASVDASLSYILERHEPFPAMIVDRLWNLRQANGASLRFFQRLGGEPDTNIVRLLVSRSGLGGRLLNRPAVASRLIGLIETEIARRLDDPEGRELLARLLAAAAGLPLPPPNPAETGPVLALHFKCGAAELKVFSLVANVGFAREASLEELRLETLLPADEATRAWFTALDAPRSTGRS